jgi:hypothetical protein
MKKLESLIYFDICLFAIEEYNAITNIMKQSNFHYYCTCLNVSLKLGNINFIDNQIHNIVKNIQLIYSLSLEDVMNYLTNFFLEEKYLQYSEAALLIKHYFRNSFL